LDLFKIVPISDHVAKFRGDKPKSRGDLALNKKEKKEKKETAAKHKGRDCVIATGGTNKSRWRCFYFHLKQWEKVHAMHGQ